MVGIGSIIALILVLVITVGIIFLQIFLSRLENRFLGLLIPVLSFMFSLVAALAVSASDGFFNDASTSISTPGMVGLIFVILNIPTVIFLFIFFACKERAKKRDKLTKMNIQDL